MTFLRHESGMAQSRHDPDHGAGGEDHRFPEAIVPRLPALMIVGGGVLIGLRQFLVETAYPDGVLLVMAVRLIVGGGVLWRGNRLGGGR